MVKVSVVLPVYKVEKYVRDCLDSIVNQTLTDIEVICVNDGSPDNSLEILREYEAKDDRITVLDQENGGHAVATNRGIELATGECLFCMDSDDILELNALEHSYNRLKEKDVDFVMFKAINYDDTNDRYYETEYYSMGDIYKRVGDNVFNYKDIGDLMFNASVTPWSKLYKREFVMEHNIRFPEGLIFEDNVFFYKALLSAKRIAFLDEFLFIRRWYATSSTTNGDLRFINSIDVMNLTIDVFKEHEEYEEYKKILLNKKFDLNIMRYNKIKKEFKEDFFKALKADFIRLFNEDDFDEIHELLEYRNKKIFDHVMMCENSIEFNNLRRIYSDQMDTYKLVNPKKVYKNLVSSEVNKYLKAPEEDKESAFIAMKDVFQKLLSKTGIYEAVMRQTPYKFKKIYQQVLISENHHELEKIRDLYGVQMRSYKFLDKKHTYNKIVELENKRCLMSNVENEESIFQQVKENFKALFEDELLYNDFFNRLYKDHQRIFNQLLISESAFEYKQLRGLFRTTRGYRPLLDKKNALTKEYKDVKYFNDSLLNSNSMKLTQAFRRE